MSRGVMRPLTLVVLLVALAACGSSGDGSDGGATPSPSPTSIALPGTSWLLVSYTSGDASTPTSVPAAVEATATFDDKKISGNDGCNNYFGEYEVDGDALTFGDFGVTQKLCGGAANEVESVFLSILNSPATFAASETELRITQADSKGTPLSLTFERQLSGTLTGASWKVTSLNNGKQAVTTPLEDSTLTAEFGDDGTLRGSAGCNSYNGPYTVEGATIDIGALATTKKLCEPDINSQETAYLAALQASTTFTRQGKTLELRDDDGALQVAYRAR